MALLSISEGLAYVTINGINYNLDWSAKTATVTQCWLLTGDITIPNTVVSGTTSFNVTAIESDAFELSEITSVTIEGVPTIGERAFYWCSQLSSVTLSEGIKSIGDYAFKGCSQLTSLHIPKSVTSIGKGITAECNKLVSITVAEHNGTYKAPDNCNAIIAEGYEKIIAGCDATVIPANFGFIADDYSLGTIGEEAFYGCTFSSINLPKGVVKIEDNAFVACNSLTDVYCESETPFQMGSTTNRPFNFKEGNITLHVPASAIGAYKATSFFNFFKAIVDLDTEVVSVGSTGMATYCSTHDIDFTEVSGLKAYIVSAFQPSSGKVILTRINDVPANTGLVLIGEEGTYQLPVRTSETVVSNMLVGVTRATTLNKEDGDYTNYILATKNDELGFYAVTDGSTLAAGKAYLPLPTAKLPASSRISFSFNDSDDVTTAINDIDKQTTSKAVYNLNGQLLRMPRKGLNIMDGKKVFKR